MKEVLRTNDPVRLSFAMHLLESASIHVIKLDQHASIIEGSIGAIQQRLMVANEDYQVASKLLEENNIYD